MEHAGIKGIQSEHALFKTNNTLAHMIRFINARLPLLEHVLAKTIMKNMGQRYYQNNFEHISVMYVFASDI